MKVILNIELSVVMLIDVQSFTKSPLSCRLQLLCYWIKYIFTLQQYCVNLVQQCLDLPSVEKLTNITASKLVNCDTQRKSSYFHVTYRINISTPNCTKLTKSKSNACFHIWSTVNFLFHVVKIILRSVLFRKRIYMLAYVHFIVINWLSIVTFQL